MQVGIDVAMMSRQVELISAILVGLMSVTAVLASAKDFIKAFPGYSLGFSRSAFRSPVIEDRV